MKTLPACTYCAKRFESPTMANGHPSTRTTCSDACRYAQSKSRLTKSKPAPDGQRHCPRCDEAKAESEFARLGTGPRAGRFQSYCRECCRTNQRSRVRQARGIPEDASEAEARSINAKPIGHTYIHKGYVMEKVGKGGHPRADRYGYVPQHIVAAEAKYGISINNDFTIHHRNADRSDNRPENLELRWGNHGKGADVLHGLLRNAEMRRIACEVLSHYGD